MRHAGAGLIFLAARRAVVVERGLIEIADGKCGGYCWYMLGCGGAWHGCFLLRLNRSPVAKRGGAANGRVGEPTQKETRVPFGTPATAAH